MPTKTQVLIPSGVNTQSARRRPRVFYDQHRHSTKMPMGRPWITHVEIPADPLQQAYPVAPLMPGGLTDEGQQLAARGLPTRHEHVITWEAPFYPHEKYQDFSREVYGRFEFRYDMMRADDLRATEIYYDLCADVAIEHNLPIPEPGKPVHFGIVRRVGQLPRSPLIAEAFLAGDPWILGFGHEPNERLQRIIAQLGRGRSYVQEALDAQQQSPTVQMTHAELAQVIATEVAKAMAALRETVTTTHAVPVTTEAQDWHTFREQHKGQGLSMTAMAQQFRALKEDGRPTASEDAA